MRIRQKIVRLSIFAQIGHCFTIWKNLLLSISPSKHNQFKIHKNVYFLKSGLIIHKWHSFQHSGISSKEIASFIRLYQYPLKISFLFPPTMSSNVGYWWTAPPFYLPNWQGSMWAAKIPIVECIPWNSQMCLDQKVNQIL